MLSIIIPSKTEKFLNKTIQDVLEKATGEIEVFPVLDGYELPKEEIINDPRVKYIYLPKSVAMKKRQGVNTGVSLAKGEYVMSLDAHCMMGKGFDEILARDCEDNWIVIPRRYKLIPDPWLVAEDGYPPIDYEYWIWNELKKGILKPYRWDARAAERKDIMIDDTLTFQGSCWFMKKSYFQKMEFMKIEGYTGWGQEDVELALETWATGGRVVVNKNTWYAHLHKGETHRRMYFMPKTQCDASRRFAFNYWVNERKDDFIKVLQKFMPIPRFPEDWEKDLYNDKNI